MISVGTKVNILDNSGALFGKCIRVYKKKTAKIGDIVLIVLKEVKDAKKLKKSQLFAAVVVQTKVGVVRRYGHRYKFFFNGVVLLKSRFGVLPQGTRIRGVVPIELKKSGFIRFLVLAWDVV